MSFYRNYRPKDFDNLVGQEHVRQTLLNAIQSGQIAHAYLFTGPRGTGKTTTARLMAKAVNCLNSKDKGVCNECEICVEIDAGKLIDVIEIDAASNRGIDEIRDLREKIHYAPTRAANKVYTIDEVHMLTKEAFNALLKTLEEPPANVYFILATTDIHKVPETVISRCQRFDFKRIDEKVLFDRLKFVAQQEGIEAEDEAIRMLGRQSRGGLRDALGLLEQLTLHKKLTVAHVKDALGLSDFIVIEKLYDLMHSGNAAEGVDLVQEVFKEGHDLGQLTKDILEFLRQKMIQEVEVGGSRLPWLLNAIENFESAHEKLKNAFIPQLPLEVAVIKSSLGREFFLENTQRAAVRKSAVPEKRVVTEVKAPTVVEKVALEAPLQATSPAASVSVSQDAVVSVEDNVNGEVGFDEIMKCWQQIIQAIPSTVVKRNLMVTKPQSLSGEKLILAFNDNFSKDKLLQNASMNEVESVILQVTGKRVILAGIVNAALFSLSQDRNAQGIKTQDSARNSETESNELVARAMELFGAEM